MRDKEGSGFFGFEGLRDGTEYIHLGNWVTSFSYPVPLGEERSRTLELWIGNCYVVIRQRL